jgi:Zn-dependent protease with chaperone function
MRTLVTFLIAVGFVVGGTLAGFAIGYGVGHVFAGGEAGNVHRGFMIVALLALAGGLIGLIWGSVQARRACVHRRNVYTDAV